jgi:hypothetical protein
MKFPLLKRDVWEDAGVQFRKSRAKGASVGFTMYSGQHTELLPQISAKRPNWWRRNHHAQKVINSG